MGYLTAHWRGDHERNERFATVPVLLDVGPQFDDRRSLDDPNVRRVMRPQAATVADEMFGSHHPDAEIEHDEEELIGRDPVAQETRGLSERRELAAPRFRAPGSPSVESRVEVWRGGSV